MKGQGRAPGRAARRVTSGLALLLGCVLSGYAAGATYYVTTGAGSSDSNPGTQASPWRTITYAASVAQGGDTVYIEGGDYGDEHVVVEKSGSSSAPIIFEGYNGRPRLNGGDRTGDGIYLEGKEYVTFRNIELQFYMDCISALSVNHLELENVVAKNCGAEECDGCGVRLTQCGFCTIRDSEVVDAGGVGIFLNGSSDCLVDNCRVLGTLSSATSPYAMDYYISISWGVRNTIQNCHAEDQVASTKGNHGIGIKDHTGLPPNGERSHDNKILNSTALNFEECFYVAHEAYGNEFVNCYGNNERKGTRFNNVFMVRDGAHDNLFRNCRGVANRQAVCVYFWEDYVESDMVDQLQANNSFVNCTFENGQVGAFLRDSKGTAFRNCTFVNNAALLRFGKGGAGEDKNTGTLMENSIIFGVGELYDDTSLGLPYSLTSEAVGYLDDAGDIDVAYTGFWNGFEKMAGEGNVACDPLFADPGISDFHLKSEYGRWDGSTWVFDPVTSLCLDSGRPASDYSQEPWPNGGRVNLGNFGNTAEASKSMPSDAGPSDPVLDAGSEDAAAPDASLEDVGVTQVPADASLPAADAGFDPGPDASPSNQNSVRVSAGCGCSGGAGHPGWVALAAYGLIRLFRGVFVRGRRHGDRLPPS